MAKYYFIRHAESLANAEGIYQGQTYDTELSSRGRIQAEMLAKNFKENVDYILTSPLKRTKTTAEILNKIVRGHLFIEPLIIETNHGLWEGKHKKFIQNAWPDVYKTWMTNPAKTIFPGGETFGQTQKRVLKWWKNFDGDNDTVIVTHDNIIRIIVADTLGLNLNDIWKFNLLPTAVTTVEKVDGDAKLIELNRASHLDHENLDISSHAL